MSLPSEDQDVPFGDVKPAAEPDQPITFKHRPVGGATPAEVPRGKLTPCDEDSERQLLAACMIEGAVIQQARDGGCSEATFYHHANRLIFRALTKLHRENSGAFDPAAVALCLRESGDEEAAGGWRYVNEVSTAAATHGFAYKSINLLREVEIRRTLALLGDSLAEHSRNGMGVEELRFKIREALPLLESASRPGDWPKTIPASELCAKPPETPPSLIDGILYRGGTMLISGPSKSHKTYTMLDQGVALASGGHWLGFKTVATPVLYLNLELQGFATAQRLTHICQARNCTPPPDFHLWNLRGRSVSLSELAVKLENRIKVLGAGVVMIDPHYKVSSVSGMEENSNDDQGRLLAALENICVTNSAALVLSHHFAKGDASAKNAIDRASGGGVFARWGDVMLTFTPHKEDDAMTIEMSLRNFAPVEPFVVRWDHPRWSRDTQLDPAELKTSRGPKEKNTASSALKALGNELLGFSEWERRSGMTTSTFKRKRQDLIDDGLVEIVGNCYRKTKQGS